MSTNKFFFDLDTLEVERGEFEFYKIANYTQIKLYKLISEDDDNGLIFAESELFDTVNNCYAYALTQYQTELAQINEMIGTIKSNYLKKKWE